MDKHEHFITAEKPDYASIDRSVIGIPLEKGFRRPWLFVFAVAFPLFIVLQISIFWLFVKGVGIWGIRIPVGWGFAIINFVWWIGIGHAGTFISAFLFLLHQPWRAAINRFAETMTLFAVMCAGMFPILHLGRPQRFYWMVPYPNTMGLWPQFRSPLMWDIFAVTTYFTVSLLFWYTGLLPDLASARDRAQTYWKKRIYGILSLGWRGAAVHWEKFNTLYLLLAGISTPLVVSVHTVVSFDFASSIVPGWHTTIFPPYFVAGAIYSGFAMVLTLMIPVRKIYHLESIITEAHLDVMAKVTLTTGLIVGYGYMMEMFIAWYSGNLYEHFLIKNVTTGPYGIMYWMLILCNVIAVQILWFPQVRRNPVILFILSIIFNIGMWLERFVIVVVSLHRDFMPSAWAMYYPTVWDWSTYLGTIGFFFVAILIFVRTLPMIASFEVKELLTHEHK